MDRIWYVVYGYVAGGLPKGRLLREFHTDDRQEAFDKRADWLDKPIFTRVEIQMGPYAGPYVVIAE